MNIFELNPTWHVSITFDCPKCRKHKISVPIKGVPSVWRLTGSDFSNITLEPSIDHLNKWTNCPEVPAIECRWHGHIIGGEVRTC